MAEHTSRAAFYETFVIKRASPHVESYPAIARSSTSCGALCVIVAAIAARDDGTDLVDERCTAKPCTDTALAGTPCRSRSARAAAGAAFDDAVIVDLAAGFSQAGTPDAAAICLISIPAL